MPRAAAPNAYRHFRAEKLLPWKKGKQAISLITTPSVVITSASSMTIYNPASKAGSRMPKYVPILITNKATNTVPALMPRSVRHPVVMATSTRSDVPTTTTNPTMWAGWTAGLASATYGKRMTSVRNVSALFIFNHGLAGYSENCSRARWARQIRQDRRRHLLLTSHLLTLFPSSPLSF